MTAFDLHAPHEELEVSGASVVETEIDTYPEDAESADWDDLASEYVIDRFDELLTYTPYVPRNRTLTATARRVTKGMTPREAVQAVCSWVYSEMQYVPGTTGVHSSAIDAWAEKKGVCQDYAHLTLVLLRSVGIPARYVSGYLHPKADGAIGETVVGESHAWIEAWTGAWLGHDPTNDVPITERHVAVGLGRDYSDVTPLKGTYIGGEATDLDVVVEITRLA